MKKIKNELYSLNYKIMAIVILGIFISACFYIGSYIYAMNKVSNQTQTILENEILNQVKIGNKSKVEIMVTTMEALYKKKQGKISDKELIAEILSEIDSARYGASGYFYVYQYDGIRLVAPENQSMVGKNLWNTKDSNGMAVIQDVIRSAKAGGDYSSYIWFNPETQKNDIKYSYSLPLKLGNTELCVGTGTYIPSIQVIKEKVSTDVYKENKNMLYKILAIIILISCFIIFAINIYISKGIAKPLKVAQMKLLESQSNLQLILDSAAEAIYGINNDGNCTFCNISCLKMLGYNHQDELLGKNMHWQIHYQHEDRTPFLVEDCRMLKTFLKGEGSRVDDEVLWRKDGSCFPVEYLSYPQFNDGVVVGAVVTFMDITTRKEVERSLVVAKEIAEESNIMKSQFLANMSHEIRTPMNGIFGYLDLINRTNLSSEQKEYIHEAKVASEILLYLINDILDLSKIEAGKLTMENISFNLRTTVEDTVSVFIPKTLENNIQLVTIIKSNVPEKIEGDPARLRQIISNLIGNAVKFTKSGEITVIVETLEENNNHAIINFQVKDTGIGISAEQIKKLFKPFMQADASTTRSYGGTGLGLAISSELVKIMGGSINVESEPGVGSIFKFSINANVIQKNPSPEYGFNRLTGTNILIVDDNETNRKILRAYLEDAGCNIVDVDSSEKAILALMQNTGNQNKIQIAIIDFDMPVMNGYELATVLKTIPSAKDVKLVLFTSIAQKGDAAEAKARGFHAYISKPVRRDELINCISLVLGLKEKASKEITLITRYIVKEAINELKPKILLVEDNETNRKIFIKVLKSHEITCDIAVNGLEGYEAVIKKDYDIVFMDCQMPVMDGYESTTKIRDYEGSKKRTFIVAMTANAMEGDKAKCIEAGMDDYISKPINFDNMFKLIEGTIKTSSSHE